MDPKLFGNNVGAGQRGKGVEGEEGEKERQRRERDAKKSTRNRAAEEVNGGGEGRKEARFDQEM